MKIIFYDCETTGLNSAVHGIHQLSGIIVIDGEVKEEFDFKMQPFHGALFDNNALLVSGVTREQIESYEPSLNTYLKFIRMLSRYCDKYDKKDKFFLAGYNNASFDQHFLREWAHRCGDKYFGSWFWSNPLDVFILASQHLIAKRAGMPDFKLKTVATHLGIAPEEEKLHDALYDVRLTKEIYDIITRPSVAIAEYDSSVHATIIQEKQV